MLSILPYHEAATNYLKKQAEIWRFFGNYQYRADQLNTFKTNLLKNTYKFDPDSEPALYAKVKTASEKLGLSLPVTLYQAENMDEPNASVVYLEEEAHIVFTGKIISALDNEELLAVIAHELAHVLLYRQMNGEMEIAADIIMAMGNESRPQSGHFETARLFSLYTEIFCDRGACIVTGSHEAMISALVKIATGLETVNVESYLKQAEQIFASDSGTSATGTSHPENFVRARALWLWHTKGFEAADPIITKMISGMMNFRELDLFRQIELSDLTRQLIDLLLQPGWMQTPSNIALQAQYFPNIKSVNGPAQTPPASRFADLSSKIAQLPGDVQNYLGYVLYDFSTTDASLEDLPLGYCFFIADSIGISDGFLQVVKKELKLSDKKTNQLKQKTIKEYQLQSIKN